MEAATLDDKATTSPSKSVTPQVGSLDHRQHNLPLHSITIPHRSLSIEKVSLALASGAHDMLPNEVTATPAIRRQWACRIVAWA